MDSFITLEGKKKMHQKARIPKILLLRYEVNLNQLQKVKYFYKFKYRLTKDYPWQVSYIPVKIDNTAPKIVSIDFSNPEKIKLITKDTYHKVKDQYKNETLFGERSKRTS